VELNKIAPKRYRRDGEAHQLQPRPKHATSVLVWGGISNNGPTPIVIFTGNMDSEFYQTILQNYFLPFTNLHFPGGYRLVQDNDPKHVSKSTKEFMMRNNITWWPTPPESLML
jgi:hypothetical protein